MLSIPAFNWQKQDTQPGVGRYLHSCNVAGNRQMISIGGRVTNATEFDEDGANDSITDSSLPDPWPQGIGVFDLTDMVWKDTYDPNAAPYITPDIVKNQYRQNWQNPSSWSNLINQGWFTKSATTSIDSNILPSPSSPAQKDASKNTEGAIVGETFGSVGSLALVAFLAMFCLRRHRHRRSLREPVAALKDDHEFQKAEMADDPLKDLEGKPICFEVPQEQASLRELPVDEEP